jgi:DNA-binding XRE family transcriptional regulator
VATRKIAGKTQAEYATLVGVSPRVLIDFEEWGIPL